MRTTLNLEDHAFAAAQAYARARDIKLGQAVSELILRGSSGKTAMKLVNGVWVFDLLPGTPKVTARQVKRLLDNSP